MSSLDNQLHQWMQVKNNGGIKPVDICGLCHPCASCKPCGDVTAHMHGCDLFIIDLFIPKLTAIEKTRHFLSTSCQSVSLLSTSHYNFTTDVFSNSASAWIDEEIFSISKYTFSTATSNNPSAVRALLAFFCLWIFSLA